MSCLRTSLRDDWFYSCTREVLQNPSRGIVMVEGVPPRQSALELFQDIELHEKFDERSSSSCFLCCRRTTAAASCCSCRSTHTCHTCSRKGFLQCAQSAMCMHTAHIGHNWRWVGLDYGLSMNDPHLETVQTLHTATAAAGQHTPAAERGLHSACTLLVLCTISYF